MTAQMHNIGYDELSSGGGTDWITSAVYAAMATPTYTPLVTQSYMSSVTNELVGGGYARTILPGRSRTLTVNGEVLTCTTIDFGPITAGAGTPGWLIVFRDTGVDATSPILGTYLMPGTPGNGVDNYEVDPPTDGLFLLGPVEAYTLPEMLTFGSGA